MRLLGRAFVAILSCASPALAEDRAGDFDFYVLSLSWSPGFCATDGDPNSAQCRGESGLVVHGLWPQYERGYPEYCGRERANLPRALVDAMGDIMPERGLIRHQWRKHGTCTGLAPKDYFQTLRTAWDSIEVPTMLDDPAERTKASASALEAAFVAANPALRRDGIAVACESGWLREIRLCLDRALAFRSCPEVDRRGCRQRGLRLAADQALERSMWTLKSSPASPFGRKIKIAAAICGLSERLRIEATDTADPADSIRQTNPLGKIPTLILEDGTVLYDSRVIAEFMDTEAGGGVIIPAGRQRFPALTLQALADGIMDAALLVVYEKRWRPAELHYQPWLDHQSEKVQRGLKPLEQDPPALQATPDIGCIALACALGYLDLRFEGEWRRTHPALVSWIDKFGASVPSFDATRPH